MGVEADQGWEEGLEREKLHCNPNPISHTLAAAALPSLVPQHENRGDENRQCAKSEAATHAVVSERCASRRDRRYPRPIVRGNAPPPYPRRWHATQCPSAVFRNRGFSVAHSGNSRIGHRV